MATMPTTCCMYSSLSSFNCSATCLTYGQWLHMKITNNALRSWKSLKDTVPPSVSGSEKSGAGVPRGIIVEAVRTMEFRLSEGMGSQINTPSPNRLAFVRRGASKIRRGASKKRRGGVPKNIPHRQPIDDKASRPNSREISPGKPSAVGIAARFVGGRFSTPTPETSAQSGRHSKDASLVHQTMPGCSLFAVHYSLFAFRE